MPSRVCLLLSCYTKHTHCESSLRSISYTSHSTTNTTIKTHYCFSSTAASTMVWPAATLHLTAPPLSYPYTFPTDVSVATSVAASALGTP